MTIKYLIRRAKNILIDTLLFAPQIIMKKFEASFLNNNVELNHSPIFIVSNPRSGSTLLYQTIARYFRVCYFSNIISLFPESPIVAAWLFQFLNGCDQADLYYSRYGRTIGWRSVNQGEYIWKRWFHDLYNFEYINHIVSEAHKKEMRNTVGMIQNFFDAPFIAKWQPLSGRILDISNIFSEALFIFLKRKPEFIAQSILCSRRNLWKDEKRWFSTKPKNYKVIKNKGTIEQICYQVVTIDNDIESDLNTIGIGKFIIVYYEELCRDPNIVMDKIKRFYEKSQNFFTLNSRNKLPSSFADANTVKLDCKEFGAIKNFFS